MTEVDCRRFDAVRVVELPLASVRRPWTHLFSYLNEAFYDGALQPVCPTPRN
ncbi:hypothetical protein QJS66_20950 [Kocuria rhizophila]|nr:hypothetical protein QJS66_20950 [Kocuria rhizophila]